MRLLALDLDGTLLDRQSRLTAENRQAVARARSAGLDVVLVTGRSWRGTLPYYGELGLTGPAICYLGALVVADSCGRVQHYRPLDRVPWEMLRRYALTEGLAVTACVGTDQAVADGEMPPRDLFAADTAFAACRAADFADWEGWNPYTQMAPDLVPADCPPVMVAVYGDRAVGRVLAAYPDGLPESQFDLTDRIAGEKVLHVWHREADKGLALQRFCAERGYQAGDVVAVGDAMMDLSMLRFSGIGVAVPEAEPGLKEIADWVMTPAEAIGRILGD